MTASTRSQSFLLLLALVLVAAAGGGCSKAVRTKRALDSADLLFQAGKYAEAETAYSNACRISRPPDPRALGRLGLVYAAEGRSTPALVYLREAVKTQPQDAPMQIELASLCAASGLPAEAKEAAHAALKLKPGDERALMALCDAIRGGDDSEQTRRYVEQLQKQDKDRASYHLALSLVDMHQTNTTAAESELKKSMDLDPKSSLAYVALARLCAFRHNTNGMDEAFKKAAELAPLRSATRVRYAELQVANGATNQARKSMTDLMAQAPDYMPPLQFMMKLSFQEHKADHRFDECNSYISKILDREPNSFEALLMKAEISLERKDGKQAVADFERLFALNKGFSRAQDQYQFAEAQLLNGDRVKAASSLKRALELDTNFIPAKITLAELYLRQNNSPAATSLLVTLLKQPRVPQEYLVPASLILARSYLAQKSPDQAIAVYHGLEKIFTNEAQLPLLEGQACLAANKPVEARAAFDKSLALNPDFLDPLEELVAMDLFESRFPAALDRVKKQIGKNPGAPLPWLLLAQIHIQQKDTSQAQADLQKAIQLDPKIPLPYLMLARLDMDQNQQKTALDQLNTLLAITNNVSALMETGVIHERLKEYDQAQQAYEKLLKLDPRFSAALNNLACLYSDHLNRLDDALNLAEKARELAPQDPYVADTLGWVLFKKRQYPRALALLQDSLARQSANGEIQYHLAMTQYMLGEEEPARLNFRAALTKNDLDATNQALRHLKFLELDPQKASAADRSDLETQIQTDPADPIALSRMAAIQERDGDFEKAAATYEKVIKLSPEDARAAIALSVLYSSKLKQAQKGLDLAKNAHNLAPDDPYISETLGRMEFQAANYPFALSLFQAAARLLPSQPDLLHDLAWAYFSTGNVAEARASMQSATQTAAPLDNKNLADAKQFLEMVAAYSNPVQAPPPARLQQVVQADTNYAPALMALGLWQQQQGQAMEAEQSYEKVLAAYPLFVPAVRQLAILYAHDGANDARAYDYALKAAVSFQDDADLAKVVGVVEYRRKNYAKSLQSLNKGAQKLKDDPEILWYQGMDFYALKQSADAKKALQRAVDLKLPPNLDAEARNILSLLK